MKRVLLIPFILLCIISCTVPACAMKNEPDDFRGVPWGTPEPRKKLFGYNFFVYNKWGLKHLYDGEYTRDQEVYIGGAKITSTVSYHFLDSLGFACANVPFQGQENYELIRKACVESWGEPDTEEHTKNRVIDSLKSIWVGERISVSISYCFWTNEIELRERGWLELYLNNYHDTVEKEEMLRKQKESGL